MQCLLLHEPQTLPPNPSGDKQLLYLRLSWACRLYRYNTWLYKRAYSKCGWVVSNTPTSRGSELCIAGYWSNIKYLYIHNPSGDKQLLYLRLSWACRLYRYNTWLYKRVSITMGGLKHPYISRKWAVHRRLLIQYQILVYPCNVYCPQVTSNFFTSGCREPAGYIAIIPDYINEWVSQRVQNDGIGHTVLRHS
jgi:hypothetical protein